MIKGVNTSLENTNVAVVQLSNITTAICAENVKIAQQLSDWTVKCADNTQAITTLTNYVTNELASVANKSAEILPWIVKFLIIFSSGASTEEVNKQN